MTGLRLRSKISRVRSDMEPASARIGSRERDSNFDSSRSASRFPPTSWHFQLHSKVASTLEYVPRPQKMETTSHSIKCRYNDVGGTRAQWKYPSMGAAYEVRARPLRVSSTGRAPVTNTPRAIAVSSVDLCFAPRAKLCFLEIMSP